MLCILTNICSIFLAMSDEMIYNFIASLEGGELLKEKISKDIKRICRYIKSKWLFIILIIIAILIRIINSEAPLLYPFTEWTFTEQLFLKPIDGSISGEILSFLDNLGMSFLASLVFLLISVTLPNVKKNSIAREGIEEHVNSILKKTENITTGCLGVVYVSNPKCPKKPFSEYTDEDIRWIIKNVKFYKEICLIGKDYVIGYYFMYETALEVTRLVEHLKLNYREYLSADEIMVLRELEKSSYIRRSLERHIDYMQSGKHNIPEETMNEIKKNSPGVQGLGASTFVDCIVQEWEIKNGVELYNKIKRIFII